MDRNYWQIAAGSQGRNYKDKFLDTGMAFVGGKDNESKMEHVRPGDIMVLKEGLYDIVAVGKVIERNGTHKGNGDKDWLRHFDGWRLPAYCHVEWHKPEEPRRTTKSFARATIRQLPQPEHRALADELLQAPICPPKGEPRPTEKVHDEEILTHLVAQGLRPDAADKLANTFRQIRLLAKYYYNETDDWTDVREHETRSFLVLPLLLALGWAEQKLKVELPVAHGKGKIDIAGFTEPYRKRTTCKCCLIVETKDFATGLDFAPEQAKRYARELDTCRILVVSNGHCYKAYRRQASGEFSAKPEAYLDLIDPRDKYPLDPEQVKGTLELLACLMPK